MAFTKAFRESTTLKLILVPFAVVNIRYIFNTFDASFINQDPMSALELSGACAVLLGIWLGRECKEVWRNK